MIVSFTIEVEYDADDGEHLVGVAAVFAEIVAEQDGVNSIKQALAATDKTTYEEEE